MSRAGHVREDRGPAGLAIRDQVTLVRFALWRPSRSGAGSDTPNAPPGPVASGSRRAVITVLDQSFASVSNFVLGVAIARSAGAKGLGGFAFAYAGWQLLAGMHRALITDPMAIEGDLRNTKITQGTRRGFAAEVLLGLSGTITFALIGSALVLTGQGTFGTAMLALAVWLPSLVVQDYWRWVGFIRRHPGRALANDTVFNCVQAAGFVVVFAAHLHSTTALIACWGLGATAGALYGFRQFRVRPSLAGGLSLLRARWSISKWLASSTLTSWGSTQAYVFIAAGILGPIGLGGLKAAQTLVSGPSGVLIMAGGSIGLPEASKAYAERGWSGLIRISRLVTGAGILSFGVGAVVIVVWGRPLLSAIYGHAFTKFEFAAVLFAIGYIVLGWNLGPILVLKSTRNSHWLFRIAFIGLVVSLTATAVLSSLFGVNGAAEATLVTAVASWLACRWYQHRARSSVLQGEAEVPPVGPQDLQRRQAVDVPDGLSINTRVVPAMVPEVHPEVEGRVLAPSNRQLPDGSAEWELRLSAKLALFWLAIS